MTRRLLCPLHLLIVGISAAPLAQGTLALGSLCMGPDGTRSGTYAVLLAPAAPGLVRHLLVHAQAAVMQWGMQLQCY